MLKVNQNNVEISWENLMETINALLDKHTSKKPMTKKELKARSKSWLTSGILTSIKNKDKKYIINFVKQKTKQGNNIFMRNLKSIAIP